MFTTKNNKKAFTLAELLIALGIIGAIAAMTIPGMLNKINDKVLITSLKNNVVSIQNLIGDQFALHKTKDITSTDFSSATELFTAENFNIVKTCTAANAQKDCWGTKSTGDTEEDQVKNAKIKYRYINGTSFQPSAVMTAVLSNGTIMSYQPSKGETTKEVNGETVTVPATDAIIEIDVNGNDAPNMVGRDFFAFHITSIGKIEGGLESTAEATNTTNCKANSAFACYSLLVQNNWEMNY